MKGKPVTDPAAFPSTDQPLRDLACFGKAMTPEMRARRGLREGG
jgi:hypothetical protein